MRAPRNSDLIHFFNLFPGPGDFEVLWAAWQKSLPWFFELAEVRSSFPLLGLDAAQPVLLVNYAHFDSLKHFIVGTMNDPEFREIMIENYAGNGVVLPKPFFGKLIPI